MAKGLRAFGHPLHAALSHVPMGLLLTSPLWDAVGLWRGEPTWLAVSYWSVAAGLAAACVAACVGAVDYAAIEEGDPALVTAGRHLTLVLCALLPYVVGMFVRGGAGAPKGKAMFAVLLLDGVGALLLSVGGWYGGHLVFHHGVGTDSPASGQRGQDGAGIENLSKQEEPRKALELKPQPAALAPAASPKVARTKGRD